MAENIHEGHRKRLKRELLEQDFPDSIPAHKVLETLLFYGIPRKDTNPIAHELLEKFGSFRAVIEADPSDLYEVNGMTENAVTLIKLVVPIARRYETECKLESKTKFTNFDQIGELLIKKHMGYGVETFAVTTFKDNGELLSCDIISKGDMASVPLTAKTIVQYVIKHKAPSAVISHSHVNHVAMPSRADIELTISVKNILSQIGVKLLDHIIVADDDYISFRQSSQYSSIIIN